MGERKQYKKFQVNEDGFAYKGEFHEFEEIAHIFFSRVQTTQKMNFMTVGHAESAYLRLTLDSGEKIGLSFDEGGIFIGFNSDKQIDIENLIDLYGFFLKKTFRKRMNSYLDELEHKGYFSYGGCTFYPSEKKIVFRNKQFPVESSRFLKGYGYIELKKRDFGFLDKVKQEVSLTKIPQFNTQTDTDVISSLLEHYFDLTWSD